jgi:addiction module RelE/StbE family toxin
MTRVRFTRAANDDLAAIAAYIKRDNPRAAESVGRRIEQLCVSLAFAPSMGRAAEKPGTRKFSVPGLPYKVVYAYHDQADCVFILRIYHTARNIP